MKRIFIASLAILLLFALILGGCAKPAPTPAPAPAPTPTPAPAPVKPVALRLTHHNPPGSSLDISYHEWAKKLEESSGGRVKVTIYADETLGKAFDHWDMVEGGVVDIAWIFPEWHPGVFPLTAIGGQPFIQPRELDLQLIKYIFDKYLTPEYKTVKVLWNSVATPMELHMAEKPVRTLEELQGLQIGTPPGPPSWAMKALGAAAQMVVTPEMYTALERGMIDGYVIPISAVEMLKVYEVIEYTVMIDLCYAYNPTVMNLERWNSLPPEIQKAIEELNPWIEQLIFDRGLAEQDEAIEILKEHGVEFIYISDEERGRWAEACKAQVDKWAAEMNDKGLPGTEIVDEVRRLAAEQLAAKK